MSKKKKQKLSLLAIDQGTTSSRAILFSPQGEILDIRQKELRLYYPHKGWVEQNPEDIWRDTLAACRAIVRKTRTTIAGIGITNQRETTVVWHRRTGKPIYNAIVWQDRRTAGHCAALKSLGYEKMVTRKTGLLLDPYFSATKLAWILDHVKGARALAEAGELAFGTIDCFLLWRLTGGRVHATDATNASRTMLYNIRTQSWDDELLRLFDIPRSVLPVVKDNVSHFGLTDRALLGVSYTIGGMAGDQQAALIGQACFKAGMVKATYGTGCFALMNTGSRLRTSRNRLLGTIAYRLNGRVTYAVEGSIFVVGAAVQWLRDGVGLIAQTAESETLARSVRDSNEVYFVPAFTGLGAPYWNPEARAVITGLTRESTRAHIVRATLEAQGYQTLDLMQAMEKDSGHRISVLRADGGLMSNRFAAQHVADMVRCRVDVPRVYETTAWGAACLAGLQVGVFKDLNDITRRWRAHKKYGPVMKPAQRGVLYEGWQRAVRQALTV